MSSLNPDFRGADKVVKPDGVTCGWGDDGLHPAQATRIERTYGDALKADFPAAFRTRPAADPEPEMLAAWNEFQKSKGRGEGSADWSLLDEFVTGGPLLWLPQLIGSCVFSNTFRAVVLRMMYQAVILGRAEEYFGRNEFGPNNFAPYAPWSYGMARRRANMKRGDGLYCAPMKASMLKDGFLMCHTPALIKLLDRLGVGGEKDYPEPQGRDGMDVYRGFGSWSYLDDLAPYADNRLLECPDVTSADQLWDLLQAGKPAFVCSGEAIHKVGTHPDGFAIHARNPRDSWSHNMAFHGCWVASDGERFIRQSNESWGAKHIYNRRVSEVEDSFRRGRLTVAAIGEIQSPSSSPPMIGV